MLTEFIRLKVFIVFLICIYMKYLIPMFDCYVFQNELIFLKAKTKYKMIEADSFILFSNSSNPILFDIRNLSNNIIAVENKQNTFYFIFPIDFKENFTTSIKCFSSEFQINLSSWLRITKNGELLCEEKVENLSYSHFELIGNFCLIYFVGERNFLVILNKDEICCATYYDECNITEKEKCFMCKLNDSLNHGNVFKIEDGKFETYLVYLDDNELNLKSDFVAFVFLDCVIAGNFKYCNNLLCDSLKMENEKDIEKFFPNADYFYPIEENVFVLFKKNTLAGIFEFEIVNSQIYNIKNH